MKISIHKNDLFWKILKKRLKGYKVYTDDSAFLRHVKVCWRTVTIQYPSWVKKWNWFIEFIRKYFYFVFSLFPSLLPKHTEKEIVQVLEKYADECKKEIEMAKKRWGEES